MRMTGEQKLATLMARYAEAERNHSHKKAAAIFIDLERERRKQLKRELKKRSA